MTIIANGSPAIGRLNDHDLPGVTRWSDIEFNAWMGRLPIISSALPLAAYLSSPADDVRYPAPRRNV